jgi:hypothetical protein
MILTKKVSSLFQVDRLAKVGHGHGQTLAKGKNLGRVFNSRSGCMYAMHLLWTTAVRLNQGILKQEISLYH